LILFELDQIVWLRPNITVTYAKLKIWLPSWAELAEKNLGAFKLLLRMNRIGEMKEQIKITSYTEVPKLSYLAQRDTEENNRYY
jgi:hypothetical protein